MKKILLAIPCANGQIWCECHESIVRNTHILRDSGYEVVPYFTSSNIYVDRVRNICVHFFLASECEDLIFVDSDLIFEDTAILKLLKHDKDIVGGVYPYKSDELNFPVVLQFNEQQNCLEESTGLVTADMIPTGLMRIRRNVFQEMIDIPIPNGLKIQKDNGGIYNFFQTGIVFSDSNAWYGEDSAFCEHWTRMGKTIYIEPNLNFTHIGIKHYKGNYHAYLTSRMVKDGHC